MKKLLLAGGVLFAALLVTVGVVAYGSSEGQAAAKGPACTGYYALTLRPLRVLRAGLGRPSVAARKCPV